MFSIKFDNNFCIYKSLHNSGIACLIAILLITNTQKIQSQYFGGRNKPSYKSFEYKVYNTPNFEIYHYFNNDSLLASLAASSQKWYRRHQMLFNDTFNFRNPIIIYANHADFQQTNAIMGEIGVGTGGVTESLKNRIVMPIMESAAQTDHVLGHEMVHAFQYRNLLVNDTLQQKNLRLLPLWMIEGMAEYLSIGSYDPNTSMWMRDAVVNNDFPSIDDLSKSNKYFPYRYGEAFWAFITAIYGDTIIMPLFNLTSEVGVEIAVDSLFQMDLSTLSNLWKTSTREHYSRFLNNNNEPPPGKSIVNEKTAGEKNIAPSLSPDGKSLIFLSEKDIFSFDLYLTDVQTGKVKKKISSAIRDNQIDDFNFLESGGTWSPDGKKFAFVIFSKGINKLLIIDVKNTYRTQEVVINGVDAFSNPTWAPDGENIVVTGLIEGNTDLYMYNLNTNTTKNLTSDVYANLMPTYSANGKQIAFVTDRSNTLTDSVASKYQLAILDLETGKQKIIPVFTETNNFNPQFSPNGKHLYFVSTADGFRNLYKYSLDSNKVYRLTRLYTGISGITEHAPAFTVSRNNGNIAYTHYNKGNYSIFEAPDSVFDAQEVPINMFEREPSQLAPVNRVSVDIVDNNITGIIRTPPTPIDSFAKVPYTPKFKLDYIGSSGAGIAVNSYWGTGMAGSVDMLFSDIVGNNLLYASLSINGEIYDFGGQVAYINTKHPVNWGVSFSHIPFNYMYYDDTSHVNIDSKELIKYPLNRIRIFQDEFSVFGVLPLTTTQRIETRLSAAHYGFRLDRYNTYRDKNGYYRGEDRERNLPTIQGYNVLQGSAAYTLDNAVFGIASPSRGQRYRIELAQYYGGMQFASLLSDYRHYVFVKPTTFAFRFMHLGRYLGENYGSIYYPYFIGYPWYVRGYGDFFFSNFYNDINKANSLRGTRILVSNFEIRLPFTGPERLCVIPSKYFYSEVAAFVDGGLAWYPDSKIPFNLNSDNFKERMPVFSYGISYRINLLGYMVLEPYYAIPAIKNGTQYGSFGLNFLPGW